MKKEPKIKWQKFSVIFGKWLSDEVRQKLSDLRAEGYKIGAARDEFRRAYRIAMRKDAGECQTCVDDFQLGESRADILLFALARMRREFDRRNAK